MFRRRLILSAMVLACTAAVPTHAASLPTQSFGSVHAEDIQFQPFEPFPAGALLAIVAGDPRKPGPYVIRVKVAGGVKLMPHTHPEDRIYTVISGVFYIGLGKTFDETKLVAYGPGSVIVLPAHTPHFHWAKSGEYVTQVTGMGPLGIDYVEVKDDPRRH
jgi:quercetin dioxygenase-like cupin family protein